MSRFLSQSLRKNSGNATLLRHKAESPVSASGGIPKGAKLFAGQKRVLDSYRQFILYGETAAKYDIHATIQHMKRT
jgi:hypothetical protein